MPCDVEESSTTYPLGLSLVNSGAFCSLFSNLRLRGAKRRVSCTALQRET